MNIYDDYDNATYILSKIDAVCFDVDSTVIIDERIDTLANFCNVGEDVKNITDNAMNGDMSFRDALNLRLRLIQPSKNGIKRCIEENPHNLTPGVRVLFDLLRKYDVDIYLVSGGFRQLIEPIALDLNVPDENVFANNLLFDENGYYYDFDKNEFTSESGGKAKVIQFLKDNYNYEFIAMIGDGVTDLEARPPADAFIGFGGVKEREIIKRDADAYVKSMYELIYFFNQTLQDDEYCSSSYDDIETNNSEVSYIINEDTRNLSWLYILLCCIIIGLYYNYTDKNIINDISKSILHIL